jgi:DNA mismatch repair ATPase MutL
LRLPALNIVTNLWISMINIAPSRRDIRRNDHRYSPDFLVAAIFVVLLCISFISLSAEASDEYQHFVKEGQSSDDQNYNCQGNSCEFEELNQYDGNPKNKEERQKETYRRRNNKGNREKAKKKRDEILKNESAQSKEDHATKNLIHQRKRDAKIVHRILKESQSNNHYEVLGLRNFALPKLRIPKLTITIIPRQFTLNITAIDVFRISENKIKKAYRDMAKLVHPDKNKDPRAVEAFLLVEKSAAILLNATTRAEYDMLMQYQQHRQRAKLYLQIRQGIERSLRILSAVLRTGTKVFRLGPLTMPVVILVALIA